MSLKVLSLALVLSTSVAVILAADEPAAGLREVFEAHEKAMNAHDLPGLMKLYAPGDQAVVMGTIPQERWVGAAEIENAYGHFFEDFDAGTVERDCPWLTSEVDGDVGWVTATCIYRDSKDGTAREFALNVSSVLQKMDGDWKLRAMHYSNPTAP